MEIHFRIVDDLEYLKTVSRDMFEREEYRIEGFFEFCFSNHKEGCYYHEEPLQEGEIGGELLDYWFEVLLEAIIHLKKKEIGYVAIKEIESVDRWIELKKEYNTLIINEAIDAQREITDLIITKEYENFTYIEPIDYSMEFAKFETEVVQCVKKFLNELQSLNPELVQTKMALELNEKIRMINA